MIILFYKSFNNFGGAEKFILNINKILMKNYQCKLITYKFNKKKFEKPDNLMKTSNIISTVKALSNKLIKNEKIKFISFSGFIDTYLICKLLKIKYNLVYFSPLSISYDEQTKFYYPLKSLFFNFIRKQRSHNIDEFYEKKNGFVNNLYYFFYSLLHYRAITNCQNLITMSKYSKKEKEYLYKIKNVWVLNAALFQKETEVFVSKHNLDEKYLLCISRLDKHKKVNELIENFLNLNKDYKLIIIGEGSERNNLTKLIIKNNLINRVHLKGFISDDEIGKYIKKCFCFVSLDIGDFKISMFDALKYGKPVIINEYFVDETMKLEKFIYFLNNNFNELINQISNTTIKDNDIKKLKLFLNSYTYESFCKDLIKLI